MSKLLLTCTRGHPTQVASCAQGLFKNTVQHGVLEESIHFFIFVMKDEKSIYKSPLFFALSTMPIKVALAFMFILIWHSQF